MVHVIDVREPSEYRADHVEGAVNLPLSQLASGATEQLDGIKKTISSLFIVGVAAVRLKRYRF